MGTFSQLISDLSRETGLGLEVDADNTCSLEFEGMIIVIEYREEADDVALFVPVTDPDRTYNVSPPVLRKALELGFNGEGTGGNFLGMFNGTLVMSRTVPFTGLGHQRLAALLAEFSERALLVRDTLLSTSATHNRDGEFMATPSPRAAAQGFMPV
ncbi:MAG: type III secretion system chaperone [Succinivibrionaceae bacterium]|nr:type III secretion system chaperone [Succinivibrionaceae bacterium]